MCHAWRYVSRKYSQIFFNLKVLKYELSPLFLCVLQFLSIFVAPWLIGVAIVEVNLTRRQPSLNFPKKRWCENDGKIITCIKCILCNGIRLRVLNIEFLHRSNGVGCCDVSWFSVDVHTYVFPSRKCTELWTTGLIRKCNFWQTCVRWQTRLPINRIKSSMSLTFNIKVKYILHTFPGRQQTPGRQTLAKSSISLTVSFKVKLFEISRFSISS